MTKKPKKKKSEKRESCSYVIEIKDWDFSYMLSVNNDKKLLDGLYWEHTDLEMKGNIVHPEKLAGKENKITIMADRVKARIMAKPEDYEQFEPRSVGRLTIRGSQSEYLGSVPFDAYQTICTMLSAGKIKYLVLHGEALYRGAAAIRSITFQECFGPDDLI